MKRLFLLFFIMVFLVASTSAYAAQKASLGAGNIAVKADYISFTADEIKNSDVDKGLYLGIEGGYRYEDFKIDYQDIDSKIKIKCPFAEADIKF